MGATNEQLQVIIDDTLSINDLVSRQAQGFSVLRSAHVGNFSAYNLTIAESGIPVLAVDHNVTGVDRNYFPESVNTHSGSTLIAATGKISCRAVALGGQFVDELQLDSVRKAVPSAAVFTNTDYVRANAAVVSEVVDLLLAEAPRYFDRLVMPNGSTARRPDAARLLGSYGIMQLQEDPRQEGAAVLLPNMADILANFAIEALKTERAIQYHLSGPDMVKYIGGLLPDLNGLYARLRATASFGARLPAMLQVRLVPTAQAIFATTGQRRNQLDTLIAIYDAAQDELAELDARRKQFFTSDQANDNGAKADLLNGQKRQRAAIETDLAECIALQPELLCGPGEPGFITQYDALAEGGLYVPGTNRERTVGQLGTMSKTLKKIAKRLNL